MDSAQGRTASAWGQVPEFLVRVEDAAGVRAQDFKVGLVRIIVCFSF